MNGKHLHDDNDDDDVLFKKLVAVLLTYKCINVDNYKSKYKNALTEFTNANPQSLNT